MRLAALLGLALVAACGPKATPTGGGRDTTPKKAVPKEPAAAALAAVQEVVARQHDALAAGDHAALVGTYAADVFAFGPRAAHVASSRDDVLRMLAADATAVGDEGGKLTWTQATAAQITLAADLATAWVSEDLDQTLTLATETRTARVHVTQVLVASEAEAGGWQVVACSWSVAPADQAEADTLAGLGRRLPELGGDGEVPVPAEPAVSRFDEQIAATDAWLAAVGPAQPLDAWLAAGTKAVRTAGGVRARLARSGTVAWIAANLEIESSSTTVRARPLVHRVRALAVYELRDGAWVAVQRHLSYGHGED